MTIDGRILPKCLKVLWFFNKNDENVGNGYEKTEILYKEVADNLLAALQNNTINSTVEIGSIKYQVSYIPTLMTR